MCSLISVVCLSLITFSPANKNWETSTRPSEVTWKNRRHLEEFIQQVELVPTWKGGDNGRSSRPFFDLTFILSPPLCGQYDRATEIFSSRFCTDSSRKSAIE